MALVIDALVFSLILTAYFSAMALGLNIIFGVLRVVNLSHGSFFMMGSFMAVALYGTYRFDPLLSLLLIIPVFFIVALPIYFALIPRLQKSRDSEIASFVLFYGVALVIQSIAISLFGTSYYDVPNSSFNVASLKFIGYYIPFSYIVAAIVSVFLIIFAYLYLYHTGLGMQTRALMSRRETAIISGINVPLVSAIAFAISIAIVAASGAFSSEVLFSTSQNIGDIITVTSFSIIIIGGLGNPLSTLIGGAVYGFAYEFASIYIPSWINVIPFLILLVIIVIRPNGVLGGKLREI
ncbi:MAG: branched-chain amino acid ABC transporter permease [Candidatus Thermoplasmatota archaeon]|nr:branched-chain amino acid ABC transporter permease [Candidatus Thermoplasmatota archaeon]